VVAILSNGRIAFVFRVAIVWLLDTSGGDLQYEITEKVGDVSRIFLGFFLTGADDWNEVSSSSLSSPWYELLIDVSQGRDESLMVRLLCVEGFAVGNNSYQPTCESGTRIEGWRIFGGVSRTRSVGEQ
jgi:hypothetical protein